MYVLIIALIATSSSGTSLSTQRIGEFSSRATCDQAGKDLLWSGFNGDAPKGSGSGYVCVQRGN
jgi:hypothetical protein